MGRIYKVIQEGITLTAASDLAQIKGATGKMCLVRRLKWKPTDNTLATAQVLSTRGRFLPATVTDGSGGTTPTPLAMPGDAAASFTALGNNTAKATTSGTAVIHHLGGEHMYSGEEKVFRNPVPVGPSESFVYELTSAAIQGTVKVDVEVEVEEIGG